MNKEMYLDLLKDNLVQSADKMSIRYSFRFYQDNDPNQTSGIVKTWLIWNCLHVVQTPAQSPVLNVIENLWSVLENKLRNHNISNASDLKRALQEEWDKISSDYTANLEESITSRLKAVLNKRDTPQSISRNHEIEILICSCFLNIFNLVHHLSCDLKTVTELF